jgi:hypothetical protein
VNSLRCVTVVSLLCLLGLAGCNSRRQSADLSFDTSVAHPAFQNDHPAILFDEAHHNIHTANGLYKPFVNLVKNDGYTVTSNHEAFTSANLGNYKILVIANALGSNDTNDAPAFTEAECDAVAAWVKAGGSLLLITDHAPTGAAAERLASRFGVEMTKGIAEDTANSDALSGDSSQLVFSRENGLIGGNPVMEGRSSQERIGKVMTFTGQALRAEKAIVLLPLSEKAIQRPAILRVEKSGGDTRVFIEYGDSVPAKGFAQAIAMEYGAGRVVVLGEAAMFTAQIDGKSKKPFGMNVPGIDNKQLVLNTMHWLSKLL